MKNMLLPLSFLASSLLPEAVRASGNPVLDVNGFGLLPGVPYYMVSSQWPIGGGVVSLGGGDVNGTCPLDVILLENFCLTGTPLTFSIASGEGLFITDSTDLYISFDTTSNCTNETMVLWAHESLNSSSAEFLTVGGAEGDVNTIFRIVCLGSSFVSSYKLVAYKLSSFDLGLTTSDVLGNSGSPNLLDRTSLAISIHRTVFPYIQPFASFVPVFLYK